MSGKLFSVCTYNVHGWRGPLGGDNYESVADFVAQRGLDAVALQEVERADVVARRLAREAGMRGTAVAHAGYAANAVLTKQRPYDGGTIFSIGGGRERRSAAWARLARSRIGDVTIYGTHLDDRSEHVRLTQFDRLAGLVGRERAIVMGDFNALRRGDYSQGEMRKLEAAREAGGVERAMFDVTEAAAEAGWVDLVSSWAGGGELRRELRQTSRFGTRVDYVFATKKLAAEVRVALCEVDYNNDASDHAAVVVRLEPVPRARPRRPRAGG